MPWHVDDNFPGCAGFAVVEDGSGDLESCEKTAADAQAQIDILTAAEKINGPEAPEGQAPTAGPGSGMMADTPAIPPGPPVLPITQACPPGQHAMPDGSCMPDQHMAADTPGTLWHGPLAIEGQWTGDGRQFAPGSLTWADLPLPLKWQPTEQPGHEGSVVVGRIDSIYRDGNRIMGAGVMDDNGAPGAECLRQMMNKMAGGVSVMADDTADSDIELVNPDGAPAGAGGPAPILEMPNMLIHNGRIRSATMVAEPAFADCRLELGPAPAMTAAAVGPHHTATEDGPWDGPAAEKRLPSPMSEATGRAFYAWIDDSQISGGQMPKTAGRFGHHDVSQSGDPGAANVKACSSAIGVLNGGRGGTTIPGGDVQGVYNHLAGHIRDAGGQPPELTSDEGGLTAAGWTVSIPEVWPEAWFGEPREAPPFGALHITPQGRVFGYLGPARVAHRAFRASGKTVTIPRGVDYSEFQNKPCLVAGADGQVYRIAAGNVTFDCGHADPYDQRRQDPSWAMQHYDNSCSIAARVRVGENEYGTWVAGGLLHGISPDAVERMMGCALSGDWQGGKLNAALLVPVEGFPVAAAASVRIREGALVSSSVPVVFDRQPLQPAVAAPSDADLETIYDLVASAVGYDDDSRWQRAALMAGRGGVS